ncbi:hypothetical protein [Klebsiella quasipneumoniae]|nr:hypothetical protein [Klebsiella quasipneumoniae]
MKIQPATGSFARNLIYSTKPLIMHRLAFIQPQTVLPAFIRKLFRFITGTIFRLPALKPASLYFLSCSVH